MRDFFRDFDLANRAFRLKLFIAGALMAVLAIVAVLTIYNSCRIDVPSEHVAVLIKKTGKDLDNGMEIAPDESYKGVQRQVLSEGRYFYNPYEWEWEIHPMVKVPTDKLGVRVQLAGEDLGYAQLIASDGKKGIAPEVLRPGRYAINPYVERIEFHDPVTIPAGYKGVVTDLAGPLATGEAANQLLSPPGFRGVQRDTLQPGTHYLNPYMTRINLIDCRSQRLNLGQLAEMGFPSKDGFWVSLDGIIEFRIKDGKSEGGGDHAALVYVLYNEVAHDAQGRPLHVSATERIDEEIQNKIILPNARSFCRLRGSNKSGQEFIGGDTRMEFQEDFQKVMREECDKLGIEIVQALITRINPPQAIAKPVRDREVARQKLGQYTQEIIQQEAEQKLAVEKALVEQKKALVEAEQEVVKMTVKAKREQEVAVTKAEEELAVAKLKLEAARDEAAAVLSRGKAAATVVEADNEAEAAGWKQSVKAFGGDGSGYARYVLYQKMAPGYRKIMTNTNNSPLMEIFRAYQGPVSVTPEPMKKPMPMTGAGERTSK